MSVLVVVDYGCGNIASVVNMARHVGANPLVSGDPNEVAAASKIIVPGVGSFGHGIDCLARTGLDEAIRSAVQAGAHVLGICLGMQLLGKASEEANAVGLGLVPVKFKRFPADSNPPIRIPHVGWNTLTIVKHNPLIPDDGEQRFYFVHSYYATCEDDSDVLATTEYGLVFPSVYSHGNIYGVQFHAEKSHRFGMGLFKRFQEL